MLKNYLVQLRNKLFGVNAVIEEIKNLSSEISSGQKFNINNAELSFNKIPEDFDIETYLKLNPDVARAGIDAKQHYLLYGICENRKYKSNESDNFIKSIIMAHRLKYLPLMWNDAKYEQDKVELSFNVFDPYKQFDPDFSSISVNNQKQLFDYSISGQSVNIDLELKKSDYQTPFAKVSFDFYPSPNLDNWQQSWFVPIFNEKVKLPDSERLFRVIGDKRESSYIIGGATQAIQLASVLEKNLKLSLDKIKVLDWGCGCGRITQFLKYYGINDLVGADIDEDNVNWCKENINGVSFTPLPYRPPTKFADNTFDAIIGISVMTHLTEEVQKDWLQEIKRILRPGGVALLSMRGLVYYHIFNIPLDFIIQTEELGFFDKERDPALDRVTKEHDYYRVSNASHRYIRNVWGQYFHILDIIEGLAIQDVVVLKKPEN